MAQVKNDNILVRAPKPVDNRSGFWLNGAWTLFTSKEQALLHPDVINYRHPGMTIPIFDGTVQVDYWFYGGVADENFVLKQSASGVVTTWGEIDLGADRLVIDWANDEVPGEDVTWLEKHGSLKDVIIQTDRPDPLDAGYFQTTLDAKKNSEYTSLILDNGGDNMRWLMMSKGTSSEPGPPTPGFWSDSDTWVDTDTWQD